MPFLRFSRDKRGYEHTYLVQATNKRGKPIRPRILYWYRTPPGVKLGRSPFDDEVRKTLETNNPGITFDWPAIVNTPFPPPDPAEIWRERRRAEKAAKQARREAEREESAAAEPEDLPTGEPEELLVDTVQDPSGADLTLAEQFIELDQDSAPVAADAEDPLEPSSVSLLTVDVPLPASEEQAPGVGRKRRRRGGRRRRGRASDRPADAVAAEASGSETADASESEIADAPGGLGSATESDESEADE